MAAPKPVGPPKPPSLGQNNEFDLARQRAQRQESANLQTQKDALARRAAQLGSGVQGALLKQEQIATDESARRLSDANEGIGAAERQEQRRLGEIAQAQEFARSERLGTQEFSAGESALQRRLAEQGLELQRYGIDTNKGFQEAQLTGKYGGQKTLAAKQMEEQTAMAKKAYDRGVLEGDRDFKANIGANTIAMVGNLKQLGYTPDQIKSMLQQVGYGDLYDSLGLSGLGLDPTKATGGAHKPGYGTGKIGDIGNPGIPVRG
jgi:hypothetical protein